MGKYCVGCGAHDMYCDIYWALDQGEHELTRAHDEVGKV